MTRARGGSSTADRNSGVIPRTRGNAHSLLLSSRSFPFGRPTARPICIARGPGAIPRDRSGSNLLLNDHLRLRSRSTIARARVNEDVPLSMIPSLLASLPPSLPPLLPRSPPLLCNANVDGVYARLMLESRGHLNDLHGCILIETRRGIY